MKISIVITFFLFNLQVLAQQSVEVEQKFNWAVHTMDRWLIHQTPVCDVCLTLKKLEEMGIYSDSLDQAYNEIPGFVSMNDIFNALEILTTLTEIETTMQFNLGYVGVTCKDCSTYDLDRKKWMDWYLANKSNITPEKVELIRSLPGNGEKI